MLKEKIIEEIQKERMEDAFLMLYFYDQVVIGRYKEAQLYFAVDSPELHKTEYRFDDTLCVEIHIFNREKEIRWRKEAGKFCVIYDTKDFFDEDMFMIGNESRVSNGCTKLVQYGRALCVPWEVEIKKAEKKNQLRLVVRHLFDDDKATIKGYRLVEIKGGRL